VVASNNIAWCAKQVTDTELHALWAFLQSLTPTPTNS
jgi:hypothetical protein